METERHAFAVRVEVEFDLVAHATAVYSKTNPCRFLLQLETKPSVTPTVDVGAPSVDLLNSYVAPAAVPSSIGVRKIQPKKGAVSRNAMQS